MSDKTAYILDASSLFHRVWSQVVAGERRGIRVSADKQLRERVHTMSSDLLEIARDGTETRLIAALDCGKTWRHDLYPPYKAHRPTKPPQQLAFFDRAPAILELEGCELYHSPGYEADDVIASLATRLEGAGWVVHIITDDHDLYQLASDRIKIVVKDPKTKYVKACDAAVLEERLGYPVSKVPFFKALAGDQGDGIKMIRGFGDVSALPYVRQYDNVDALWQDLEHVAAKDRRKMQEAGLANLQLAERLTTLDRTTPVLRRRTLPA